MDNEFEQSGDQTKDIFTCQCDMTRRSKGKEKVVDSIEEWPNRWFAETVFTAAGYAMVVIRSRPANPIPLQRELADVVLQSTSYKSKQDCCRIRNDRLFNICDQYYAVVIFNGGGNSNYSIPLLVMMVPDH